jgi:hypothetical protein
VQLTYTSDGVDQRSARLPIVVSDVTPPSIDVVMSANVEPQTSFGGIARYVSPIGGAVIVPLITVSDACDQNPSRELFLNEQAYVIGTPVTSLGLHFLRVRATDAYGNVDDNTFVFEIRERPSHAAVAVVESTQCEISPDGQTGTFGATVLISDDEFDHHDILLSSVRLFLIGANGRYLNTKAFPIADGYQGDCPIFQPLLADAQINDCLLVVRFEGTFVPESAGGCPVSLDIVGAATSGVGDLSFEWGARTANVAEASPAQTLLSLVGKIEPCGEPQPPPGPPPPPPPCDAIETYISNSSVCPTPPTPPSIPAVGAGCGPGSSTLATLDVWVGTPFRGRTIATANALPGAGCGTLTAACGPLTGGSVLIMQFVGNCCDCAVTYSVQGASVGPKAWATGTGSFFTYGSAWGTITVIPPCGPTSSASSSASLLFSPSVNPPSNPVWPPAVFLAPPVNCTEVGCHTSMMFITATGSVFSQAQASNGGTARAFTTLSGVIGTINASPTFAECPPDICEPQPGP